MMCQNASDKDLEMFLELKKEVARAREVGSVDELINCDTKFHRIIRNATKNDLLSKT